MALGCGLISVKSYKGENYENEPLVCQKHRNKTNSCLVLHAVVPTSPSPLLWAVIIFIQYLLHVAESGINAILTVR
jgi:hypothetical protein